MALPRPVPINMILTKIIFLNSFYKGIKKNCAIKYAPVSINKYFV